MNKEKTKENIKLLLSILFENNDKLLEKVVKCIISLFTTKKFCRKYNICNKDSYETERISTNNEFINFFQTIYHAGNTQQFFNYIRYPNNLNKYIYIDFHYMFDIFKKGIYVYIKNKKIEVYLPFSNAYYRNDWGQNLKTKNGDFKSVLYLEEKNHWNPKFIPEKYHTMIQKDLNKWYANYAIFRNTIYKNGELRFKDDEGDKSIVNFLELLIELCYNKVINDVCFFISPRDFPILRKDRMHPYDRLYKGSDLSNLGKLYNIIKEIPIFTQSITDEYDEEMIPNDDDIVNILCSKKENYKTNWSSKKTIAIFRGSATGIGTTIKNNKRLKLYELAKKHTFMDVKLIGLNDKLKVDENGYVTIIDKTQYPKMDKLYKETYSLNPLQQSEYKYIIHVEGHVAAFRLTRELAYGSLILKVNSKWKTWYSDKLIGWKIGDSFISNAHYIIIEEDLSNLISSIEWCINNDNLCEQIAKNSLKFYNDHFTNKDYILNYMQEKLNYYSEKQKHIHSSIKGLIIIPFRNTPDNKRQEQLNILTKYLSNNCTIDYKIIIQEDSLLFNRGLLLNKGVLQNIDYDYYIFHDVDLLPDEELLRSYYIYPEIPIHLGIRGQRWSSNTDKFIGGVFSINKYDFLNINGFPNDFSGWGGEDDALLYRLKINGIKITTPSKGSVKDLENLNIENKLKELKVTGQKNMIKQEQLLHDKKNWFNNGIKQLF